VSRGVLHLPPRTFERASTPTTPPSRFPIACPRRVFFDGNRTAPQAEKSSDVFFVREPTEEEKQQTSYFF
jgi:hypothetical protein